MFKVWAVAFLMLLSSWQPLAADSVQPFFAVFVNPGWEEDFEPFRPDLMATAYDFDQFELFINNVNRLAKGRPVIIDIAVHGSPDGGLYIQDGDDLHESNPGYILNQLERVDHLNKVYLESCYAGLVMARGLNTKHRMDLPGDDVEPFNNKRLKFDIYGVNNTPNYVGFVYMQDRYKIFLEYYDLKKFLNNNQSLPDKSKDRLMWFAYCVLKTQNL